MENAGKRAAAEILRKFGKLRKVQIFCGSGGNGGDGFVVAHELLKRKIEVEVILASEVRNRDAQFYFAKLPKKVVSKFSAKTKIDGEILVDAILGVGARGKLQPPISTLVARLKKARTKIVSLDVPTGGLKSNLVVAFHASKNSKNEIVVDIGIPKSAEKFFGPGDVWKFFPRRKLDSHKNENGRVVVVGGSREFVGAPFFAALGASAAGVDLVDIFVPKINFVATRKFSPNFLVHEFSGNSNFLDVKSAREILSFANAKRATLVVGCGLGRDERTHEAIEFFAQNCRRPLVFDAGALVENLPKFVSQKVVLTPHAVEFRRLAKNPNAVILKKGRVDEIFCAKRKRWSDSGAPILTVGGSGDTLAGLVGGLLARNVEPFEAAGIAAFLVGTAGEKITLKSESTTPQKIAAEIPKIIRQILTTQK